MGPVAEPKPNAIGSSKNASDPVGIPLFGAPQAPGDKPNPSEEGYSLGGRPEARGDVSSGGTHPNRLCSSQPQPVESTPPQDTKHRQKNVNSITKTFFTLTDQMTISGRFAVDAISVGNMKLCFKSVATCQSVQLSSNDGLRIFSRAILEIFPSLTN